MRYSGKTYNSTTGKWEDFTKYPSKNEEKRITEDKEYVPSIEAIESATMGLNGLGAYDFENEEEARKSNFETVRGIMGRINPDITEVDEQLRIMQERENKRKEDFKNKLELEKSKEKFRKNFGLSETEEV